VVALFRTIAPSHTPLRTAPHERMGSHTVACTQSHAHSRMHTVACTQSHAHSRMHADSRLLRSASQTLTLCPRPTNTHRAHTNDTSIACTRTQSHATLTHFKPANVLHWSGIGPENALWLKLRVCSRVRAENDAGRVPEMAPPLNVKKLTGIGGWGMGWRGGGVGGLQGANSSLTGCNTNS
jgi:hypothetical protein